MKKKILKIALGSDHGGFRLKEELKKFLKKENFVFKDFGTYSEESCDYPKVGKKVIAAILKGRFNRGILICKTGIGFSIMANRFSGIRAALCSSKRAARFSREHNDSNVLILGALLNTKKVTRDILNIWLTSDFSGGRHLRRLKQIERFKRGLR